MKIRSYKEVLWILKEVLRGEAEVKQIAKRPQQIEDVWEVKLRNGVVYRIYGNTVEMVRRE